MLNPLRQYLYKRKEQQTNERLLDGLSRRIAAHEDIYIVHQMGRVASMTLTNSLQSAMPGVTIYHTHYLNPKTLDERRAVEKRLGRPITQRHFRVSELLAPAIQNQSEQDTGRWKVVTIFRDPVARNISAFYLSIEDYMPNFQKKYAEGAYSTADFLEVFLNQYSRDYAINWFDREVNQVFNLDVYGYPFPTEKGYSVISSGNLDLLAVKLEKLKECVEPAVKEFLGLEEVKLIDTHITQKDEKDGTYSRLLEEISLPEEYLEHIYSSRFASHFYAEEELKKFREKWAGN